MKTHIKYYHGVPMIIRVDGRKVGHGLVRQARRKVVDVQVGMLHFHSEQRARQFVKALEA